MTRQVHALYPGTFDVLTLGHLDIIRRATRIFDKVTVAIAENPAKRGPLFTAEERVDMLRRATAGTAGVEVKAFSGLTVAFARSIGASVIVRGLRAISDFEFELQMAMMNDNQAPEITTVFMAPSPQFSFLSSSLVKEIARFGGDVSEFVPPEVGRLLKDRLEARA
jgi:pantetheine-phosphate adenylyltransferase